MYLLRPSVVFGDCVVWSVYVYALELLLTSLGCQSPGKNRAVRRSIGLLVAYWKKDELLVALSYGKKLLFSACGVLNTQTLWD